MNRNEPFQINNQFVKDINESFTKVSVGKKHNFVLTDYGNTYSWGDAFSGMLATGSDIDQKFPGDVSANIDTRSDTLKEYVLGYSHSYAWTEEGSLYGVGSNYAGYLGLGQVPSTYSMLNITKSIDDLSLIKFLYLPEQYVGSSKIYLKIYPEYNIFDNLESIRINGIDRDLNYLEGENGEITFSIDHTNIVGDTISMEVDGFTYADGYVQATGATYAEAEMSVDYEDPTFDVTSSMTMPIGSAEIDWTTLANNIEDNSFGPITLFSIDDVNYSVVGEYSVTITATDESGNSTSHSFPVMIVDNYGPVIEYTGPTIFEAGSEYNLLTGLSAIDSYDGDITEDVDITDGIDIGIVGNYQVEYFVSDSSGNTDTLIVDVEVVDTTSPTFDDPLDVGPIGVGVLGNEDWTSQIVNLSDNSTDTMITGFTDDIDYTMPGMYTVSVWAEDTSGNRTTKQFNVELVDNAPPTIDILQDITIGLGESIEITTYFTATDLIDGDVTNLITLDDSGVNYNLVGVYSLIVYAYDLSMNQQQIIVEVHINDVVDPSFNVIEELDLELGDETKYDWLTLVTNLSDDSGITPDLMIVHDDVDFTTIGTFSVGIKATDEAGNFTEEYIIVTIVDTTAPVVELKSGIDTLFVGEEHIDGGITIDELTDYTMTSESTINADDPGSYTITYLVVDESLNETEIIRHVTVLEKNPEVEFELGAGFTSLDIGDTLNTPTCTFRFDGNPVPCVFDSAGVDMSAAGTYTFTASANYQGETYSREIYVWVWDFDVKQSSPIGYWKREEEVML